MWHFDKKGWLASDRDLFKPDFWCINHVKWKYHRLRPCSYEMFAIHNYDQYRLRLMRLFLYYLLVKTSKEVKRHWLWFPWQHKNKSQHMPGLPMIPWCNFHQRSFLSKIAVELFSLKRIWVKLDRFNQWYHSLPGWIKCMIPSVYPCIRLWCFKKISVCREIYDKFEVRQSTEANFHGENTARTQCLTAPVTVKSILINLFEWSFRNIKFVV